MASFRVRGDAMSFANVPCHVLDTARWSESHLAVSGGGGHIIQGTGTIHAPRVDHQVAERSEVWFSRDRDASEFSLRPDIPLNCRPGHPVSLLLMTPAGQSDGHWMGAINHATGEAQELWTGYDFVLVERRWRASRLARVLVLYPLLTAGTLLVFGASPRISLGSAIAQISIVTLPAAIVIATTLARLADASTVRKLRHRLKEAFSAAQQ